MKKVLTTFLGIAASFVFLGLMAACQSSPTSPVVPAQVSLPTAAPTVESTPGVDEVRNEIVNALMALNLEANRMDVTTVPNSCLDFYGQ